MDKEKKRFVDHFSDNKPPHQIIKHPNIQWCAVLDRDSIIK